MRRGAIAAMVFGLLAISACSDEPPASSNTFAVGGTVSGLRGTGLVLQLNGGSDLAVSADGSFAFPDELAGGSDFAVTVLTQPTSPHQTCSVADGAGRVGSADVTSIKVDCATDRFAIGGTVTGLAGSGLVLQNNGGDDLAIEADGAFAFASLVESGQTFTVTIKSQPGEPAQTCSVSGGSGTVVGGPVESVAVNCSTNRYTISGTVSGLAGSGLVLQNNGGDDLAVNANGTFAFATPVESGAQFVVTVSAQPVSPWQSCTVSSGSGTVAAADVGTVVVECATDTHTVGGTVNGMAGSGLVLQNNLADNLPVTSNGSFLFPAAIESGKAFAVTVLNQPTSPWQTCTVSGGSGTVADADVVGVEIGCQTNTYSVGGTVTGLIGTGLVLVNGDEELEVAADGSFRFATPVASGASFEVAVLVQPVSPWQTCTVSGGSGIVEGGDVDSVTVNCDTNAYAIGGTITGLAGGGLELALDGGQPVAVNANGDFAFPVTLESGSSYAVTVVSQPTSPWQTCTLANESGTVEGADVTSIEVTCETNTYAVGGTVSGLAGSGLVLRAGTGEELAIAQDGAFRFEGPAASGEPYTVTIAAQPTAPWQTCTIAQASGTVGGGDVDSVAVTCETNRYTVGGSISGLAGTVVLQNNGSDALTLTANGPFAFANPVASGESWEVTVASQPGEPAQLCTVTDGSGEIAGADVTGVTVTCVTLTFQIRGTVTGLAGSGLVLQDNGGDDLAVLSNGGFVFATPVASGAPFRVTVLQQPSSPAQTCTVSGGEGTVGAADVTSISVNCETNRYAVGGAVSGLAGTGLVLQVNGGDDLAVSGPGGFAFATPIASGERYLVTVLAQPTSPWQTCTVMSGQGTVGAAAVSSVEVICVTEAFMVGVEVSGLRGSGLVLQNQGADNLAIATDGRFTFATPMLSGSVYEVSALTQPTNPWQTCSIESPTGAMGGSDVTLAVSCRTNTYSIGGVVTGLAGSGLILSNNGGDDLPIAANGAFTFAAEVPSGSTYAVAVKTQPSAPMQFCSVTRGGGTVQGASVTDVAVDCITRLPLTGSYAAFLSTSQAAGHANVLVPGDSISEANDFGGFYFKVDPRVTRVRISITGAAGSAAGQRGGTGGAGVLDLSPSFLASQGSEAFWVILGQSGRPSAGPAGGTAAYRAFNGGGAATDWSSGTGTYSYAAGGGGASDVRLSYDGSVSVPHSGNPTASFARRFAVVGGGGGATLNGGANGGYGGGFNSPGGAGGGSGSNGVAGTGGTLASGGSIGGTLGLGGDGLQNGTEGWAGGGGGGYFGGGASTAHWGGGGGSGYLMSATGLTSISTSNGVMAGCPNSTTNGAFTVTAY